MVQESISLGRALTEVKNLEARINRTIQEGNFLGVVTGKDSVPTDRTFKTRDDMETKIKAQFQSLDDLVKRRTAIKKAITEANTQVTVNLLGQTMTLADAVDLKQSLWVKEKLLNQMVSNVTTRGREVEKLTKELDDKVERLVVASFGNNKVDPSEAENTRKSQYAQYGPSLVDPVGVMKKIDALKAEIDEVKLNLDFTLSEVNAKTMVYIVY